ncbi:OsmC-like protein [Acholeplasma laidlawii PG-8A]|uniref:OsmC-like protein n=3 Tax=Acholeplasma laidlawii TaxID=2148 RepID=A9NEA2_ACHLI|nr:OsmC-like protein [Acholeplasma laidlawii PG-8A]PII03104.1 organic hydroperoxide resistance protein [Acholeplasma laidlawii]TRX99426.1 OsmC family peroxiredoxin [Acholeplasma laidlawii]
MKGCVFMDDLKQIYETVITNMEGTKGFATADNGHAFGLASVLKADTEHTNPEQLIGAAWATCLNAAIISVIRSKKLTNRSRVDVKVKLWLHPIERYSFTLDATAAIEDLDPVTTKEIIDYAHRLCPVSKLIGDKPGVTLTIVPYQA